MAAGRNDKASSSAAAESVEMFSAMAQGQIEVKLIPKDSTQSRVIIENKTKKALSVKLPDAFAGVPVLAQLGGGAEDADGDFAPIGDEELACDHEAGESLTRSERGQGAAQ